MAFFTIAATVVLVLTLQSANRTNRAAVQASEAALEANKIIRNEQRPWIKFTAEPHGSFSDPDGGSFTFWVENMGSSPARNVFVNVFESQAFSQGKKSISNGAVPISIVFPKDRAWGYNHRPTIESGELIFLTAYAKYTLPNDDIGTTQAVFHVRRQGRIVEIVDQPWGQAT